MSSKRKKRKTALLGQGRDWLLVTGLPVSTLSWTEAEFKRNTSVPRADFIGIPAPPNDWANLYRPRSVDEFVGRVYSNIARLISARNIEKLPKRIFLLYVPSRDSERLLSRFRYFCYPMPLHPNIEEWNQYQGSPIGWRSEKPTVFNVVRRHYLEAITQTDVLKSLITDQRTCELSLPPKNFFFPDPATEISVAYDDIFFKFFDADSIDIGINQRVFTRKNLSSKVFKYGQTKLSLYQDSRRRVFPPSLVHAPVRWPVDYFDSTSSLSDEEKLLSLRLFIQQRYRFGVIVRDGNLHYDVQFQQPEHFSDEPMTCAARGPVRVTGTHANVGVNDVVWAPSGHLKEAPPG